MFPMPAKYAIAITCLCLLIALSGCRNRGLCGYNSCTPCFSSLTAPTTVPAPATYSMQIPSAGQNQPYYNGGAATAQNLLQTGGAAPTPITGASPNLAPQNGWREAGTNDSSQYLPASNNQGQSVLASNSTTRPVQSVTNRTTGGLSYRDNMNYQTTAVDERLDQTRLAATDATNVRAPAGFQSPTMITQAPQFLIPPARYQNFGSTPQNTAAYPNQRIAQNQPIVYHGNPTFAGTPTYGSGSTSVASNVIPGRVEYYGQPTFAQPANQTYPGLTSSAPAVLAQSTVYSDPRGTQNFQNGWRDRDLNSINR